MMEKLARYKQPNTLENLAVKAVGEWVAQQAERYMEPIATLAQRHTTKAQLTLSNRVDFLRDYMQQFVPWILYDSLATETITALADLLEKTKKAHFRGSMGKFVSQMNVVVKMTEVLFTKYLTIVSIDTIPKMIRSIFYTKLNMLTGIVCLNLGSLSGGWKTNDMEESIIDSLKNLHQLKYLYIHYDCTDNILKCVEQNCKQLEKLDVSSSKCITNDSIGLIIKLNFLRSINLYRTSVSLEGFAKLLTNCRSLEDIGRFDEIGRVLEYIDLTNHLAKPFQLKTFVSRYASENQLKLTVEMCPLIQSITVFHNTLKNDLMLLIGLQDLRELKLLSCDFYADQVKQVLQVKGCNISHLHLEHVDQIDLNALMYISQMCPLLQSFTLYNCTLINHTSLYTSKLEILPFRNVKKFTCVATCTDEQLSFILGNCINVEYVHLGTAVQLTDQLVFKILDKNPLIHLKELRIMQSDFLTMKSIETIIQNCMSLETLVELDSWTLLSENDRDHIKNYIKVNNLNINTVPQKFYYSNAS